MSRSSEFSSYVFIKNDLERMGWNTKNPSKGHGGQVYTQQECLDHPEISLGLGKQRPEYVIKISEDTFWVIEAKARHQNLDDAFNEAFNYACDINKSHIIKAKIVTGVAGNDDEGYLLKTAFIDTHGNHTLIKYNNKLITGLLSPQQAKYLSENDTANLNELVTDENILMDIAESINEELHRASINKDSRATVMSAVLLSMVSDTLPNFNASPDFFIKDINNRAEDILIHHAKREFADYIELKLPQESSAKEKYKSAVTKVFFLLRKINIKAAMDGSHDLLGKFYEVFLKYGNGAKDIGIVLTPRHITEFAADILDIKANDLVYDPACGTGGFLVAAYDKVRKEDKTGVEMFKKHRIFGIEQQANVAALAIVNMIFRGDGKNNIINGDCLSVALNRKIRNDEVSAEYIHDERINASRQTKPSNIPPVTKVLMNPPFALKRDDEQEYTFINHALSQMCEGGLLLCVIPISVMYSSGKEAEWRKRIVENNTLLCITTLPNDLFYPQASVEPVIIVIRKGVPQNAQKCLFCRITDDGFLKQKRRRVQHGKISQLESLKGEIFNFIHNGNCREINGILQAKELSYDNNGLEFIPQQYLDNEKTNPHLLKDALVKIHSELLFQQIRKGLK